MRRRLAWPLCGLTVLMAAAGLVLQLAAGADAAFPAIEALMLAAIAAVGALVASRVPDNPCGWLVAVIPASFALTILGTAAHDLVVHERGAVEGIALVAPWVASWSWIPAMLAVAVFAQVFPTGRPLTPRWRVLLWSTAASAIPLFIGTAFERGRFEDFLELTNPVGASGTLGDVVTFLGAAGFAVLIFTLLGAFTSIVIRWRRSSGTERQQLKWVATAALGFPFAFAAPTDEGAGEDLGFALLLLALFLLAASVAVAILRYRLYDIDVVIRRTLVYVVLSAALAGVYFASVLVLGLVLPARSDLAVAVSTLAAAAVVRPARLRIQRAVDRRFFRRRYDVERTLAGFGARLRDELDLEALSAELRAVAAETMQPAHVSLWLRAP